MLIHPSSSGNLNLLAVRKTLITLGLLRKAISISLELRKPTNNFSTLLALERRLGFHCSIEVASEVVVLGGGSFDTAMAAHVANRKAEMEVSMLMRDPHVCQSFNQNHLNCKYFPNHKLPENLIATTNAKSALQGADFCLHVVPVQVEEV